jgi:hypothetical protein
MIGSQWERNTIFYQQDARSPNALKKGRFCHLLILSLIDNSLYGRIASSPAHVGLCPRGVKASVDAALIAKNTATRGYALLILCLRLATTRSIVQVSLVEHLIWRVGSDPSYTAN